MIWLEIENWRDDSEKRSSLSNITTNKYKYHHCWKSTKKEELDQNLNNNNQKEKLEKDRVRNLPSTVVRQEKPSVINSTIVISLAIVVILAIWIYRSYGVNTFIIIDFYIREFFFNLNLIISDLAKIIHNTLN